MHGRPVLGALVLAATIAFVVGAAIERGSGEAHATQRAKSHGSGHIMVLAAAMLAFAALDVREVAHHIAENRTALAVLAGAVTALHATAAALAGYLARPLSATRGRRAT
jgi:DMSO/TMAO reductase YedYZ heme-binding membrane subunit